MATVYVGNLHFRTSREELEKQFATYGKVKEAKLITYRGYSRGFGFVEYEKEEDAKTAVAANGVEFMGRKLKVAPAEPQEEKKEENKENKEVESKPKSNRPRWRYPSNRWGYGYNRSRYPFRPRYYRGPYRPRFSDRDYNNGDYQQERGNGPRMDGYPNRRPQPKREVDEQIIYIRNLKYGVTEEQLKDVFKSYGVESCTIPTYKKGEKVFSKGFAFVTVKDKANQEKAINDMNGKEFEGRKLICRKGFKKIERPAKSQ